MGVRGGVLGLRTCACREPEACDGGRATPWRRSAHRRTAPPSTLPLTCLLSPPSPLSTSHRPRRPLLRPSPLPPTAPVTAAAYRDENCAAADSDGHTHRRPRPWPSPGCNALPPHLTRGLRRARAALGLASSIWVILYPRALFNQHHKSYHLITSLTPFAFAGTRLRV